MTLIQLLLAIIAFFLLLGTAKILDTYVRGSFWMDALILAAVVSMVVLLRRYAGNACFPKCKNGICGPRDYEGVPVRPGDAGIPFKCKCGQRYLLKRNRFMLLGDDGQATPYKIKRQFYSRWTDDVVTNRIDTSTPPGAR